MFVKPINLDSSPPVVRVFDSTLFLHAKQDCPFLSRVLMRGELFEPFETHLLRREIRPGDVVLDIGANIGYYTVQFARLVGPLGKVIAFEPDAENFRLLQKSVAANGFTNVELVNAAVSNERGRVTLHRSPKNPGDHRVYGTAGEERQTTQVEVTTLDAFFTGRSHRIDFIKMDIQGSEANAIEGARALIAANPFLKLTCEFWPAGLQTAGADPQAFLHELSQLGFCVLQIDETKGRLVPARSQLLEELPTQKPAHTNLYCIKTSPQGRDVSARADTEVWRVWRSPQDLRLFERRVFSQNGEDGIVEEILRRIGPGSNTFVEFGSSNGTVCNCAYLVKKKGWRGLFMEGDPQRFEGLRATFAAFPDVKTVCARISAKNIEQLFADADVPADLDLLSIDIDGNDYWVWKAITSWQPRIVIVEVNGQKRPPERWVMPEDDNHSWSGTDYYGASLAAMRDLGREKGYVLVGTESRGVNAFFVRSDLVTEDKFPDTELAYHYSPPTYGPYLGGHRPDDRK